GAALAAAKQWEYEPTIVNGKGAWIRILASITVRPRNSATGSEAAGSEANANATANPPPSTSSSVDTVNVSTGVSRAGSGRVTPEPRAGQGSLHAAFCIASQSGSRQALLFRGPAHVLTSPGDQLAVLPLTGRGWVFLPGNATWTVTEATTPPVTVKIVRV